MINVFLYECNAVTLRVQEMRAHSNLHLTKLRLHRRRREMVNRPAAPTGAASQSSAAAESEVLKQKKANETQQAVVLFIIVLASTRALLLAQVISGGILGHSLYVIYYIGDGGGIRFRCLRQLTRTCNRVHHSL